MDGPVRAVGVESPGDAVRGEDGAQRRHDGHGAFAAGDELGVEELLGRVVDDGDEGLIGVRREGKPAMAAAV